MNNPQILIVDDRVDNLKVLEATLSDLEVDIVRALSGNEAIAKTLEHDFAIALIDVQMPGMDGFETVNLLRKNKQTENLPVIFVTASLKEEYHQIKGIEIGAVDFMIKPIVPAVLLGKIRVFLNLYNQRIQLANTVVERDKALLEFVDYRDHLEQLILERTTEIERANEKLTREITERKLAEEASRRAEEALRLLIANSLDAIFRIELDKGYTYMSPSVEKLLGYHPEDYYNDSEFWQKITFTDDISKVEEMFATILEGKEPPSMWELRQFDKDRNLVHLEFTSIAIRNEAGKIVALEGVARDITERKLAEEELKKHRDHLEEMVAERTEELQKTINLMAGREVRMADLKEVVQKLRAQIESAGLTPVADDPIKNEQFG